MISIQEEYGLEATGSYWGLRGKAAAEKVKKSVGPTRNYPALVLPPGIK